MNRRADYCRRIAVSALVLAVISLAITAGRTAWAQDGELTLAGLSEQLASLVSVVDALEEVFADPWSPDVIYTDDGICQSPLHAPHEFIALMQTNVHQETADAYRAAYGVSIKPSDPDLVSLSFAAEGKEIYLEYIMSRRNVVETWANCEFLGHSEWEDQ